MYGSAYEMAMRDDWRIAMFCCPEGATEGAMMRRPTGAKLALVAAALTLTACKGPPIVDGVPKQPGSERRAEIHGTKTPFHGTLGESGWKLAVAGRENRSALPLPRP